MTADDRNPDTTTGSRVGAHDPISHYEIRVKGRLAPHWSAWFDGLTIDTDTAESITAIRGPVVDQAALHGLLQRLRDVGLILVSVTEMPNETPIEPPTHPNRQED